MTNEHANKPAATDLKATPPADASRAAANASNAGVAAPHEGTTAKLKAEIKKIWDKLTDEEVSLFDGKKDQFFDKVKEKHSVSKDDAEKKIKELEASCGSCATTKAA